jgi:ribosomal protein L24E
MIVICQNVKHSLQTADESLQPQPSPPPTDAAVHPLPVTSPSIPAITNAQQMNNGLLMAGSIDPTEDATSLRTDVTDCQRTIDDDFNPKSLEWTRAVRVLIRKHQTFLIDHVDITGTFADMLHTDAVFTRSEYTSIRALGQQNPVEQARSFIADILPKKPYAHFKVAIRAFDRDGQHQLCRML